MDTFERNLPVNNLKSLLKYIQEKLLIQYSAEWIDGVYLKSKLCLYRTFKDQYSVATYCNVNLTRAQRALVAKIRLGIFPINVETGRYSGKPRNERKLGFLVNQKNIIRTLSNFLKHVLLSRQISWYIVN